MQDFSSVSNCFRPLCYKEVRVNGVYRKSIQEAIYYQNRFEKPTYTERQLRLEFLLLRWVDCGSCNNVSTCYLRHLVMVFIIVPLTLNLFHATGLFLYPLKTSENQRFSDVFRAYRKRAVVWNGLISFWHKLAQPAFTCSNMFKVNNKDTRTTPMASFWCLYR